MTNAYVPIEVLVEDDPGDVLMTRRRSRAPAEQPAAVVGDGDAALDFCTVPVSTPTRYAPIWCCWI
jgi:hypothetical protein